MPETEATRNIRTQDGIMSKAFYQEFIVTAGKPVNAYGNFSSSIHKNPFSGRTYHEYCYSAHISFIPEAVKDYEIITLAPCKRCTISVFELIKTDEKVQFKPVDTEPAIFCEP